MTSLPSLSEIQICPSSLQSPLTVALDILFEHSSILGAKLEPQLHVILQTAPQLESFTELIHIALSEIQRWDLESQAEFIAGHPRIGESKNLSKLSASEQGDRGANPTPPEVLARLAHLNGLYEVKYPGLRYITFVNGRTRAEIVNEMEGRLEIQHSLLANEPDVGVIVPVDAGSQEWKHELRRAVFEVGMIALGRLGALGVE